MEQRGKIILRDCSALWLNLPHALGEFDHFTVGQSAHQHCDFIERLAIQLFLKPSQIDVGSRVHRYLITVAHIEFATCAVIGYIMPDWFCAIAPGTVIVGQGAPENIVQHRRPFGKLNLSHVTLHQPIAGHPDCSRPRLTARPPGAKQLVNLATYMIFDTGSRGRGSLRACYMAVIQ
jgi:hypothetical protein